MLRIYVNDPQVKREAAMLDFLARCVTDAFSRYMCNKPYAAKDYVGHSVFFFNEQVHIYLTHNVTEVAICNAIRNDDAYACINYEHTVEYPRITICNLVTNNEDDIDHAISWVIKEWVEAGGNERTFMNNWEFHAKKARERELRDEILTDVTGSNYGKERTQRNFRDLDGTVYHEVVDNFGCHYFEPHYESADSIHDFLTGHGFESTESAAQCIDIMQAKRDFIKHSLNATYGLTTFDAVSNNFEKVTDYCVNDVIAIDALSKNTVFQTQVAEEILKYFKSNEAEKEERTDRKMKSIPTIKHISVGEEHKTGRVKTTIVWDDHTKTTVVCRDGETPDMEKGILLCVWEKMNGGSKTKAKEKLRQLVAEASKPKKEKRKANDAEGILNHHGKELVDKLTDTVKQASNAFSSAARKAMGLNDED